MRDHSAKISVFLFGKGTIIVLSFTILREVDDVHAEKPMETDPARVILYLGFQSSMLVAKLADLRQRHQQIEASLKVLNDKKDAICEA